MSKVCRRCGQRFEAKRDDAKFCSANCRVAAHRAAGYVNPPKVYQPRPPRQGTCAICGSVFTYSARGRARRTCSLDCRIAHRTAERRAFHERRVADGRQAIQNDRRRKVERHPCVDCGQEVWNSHGQRCRGCAQAFARMLRRAAGHGLDLASTARVSVFDRDGWLCQLCGEPIDPALAWPAPLSASVDHRVPLSKCLERLGPDYVDSADNWQAAHLRCNASKGAREAS